MGNCCATETPEPELDVGPTVTKNDLANLDTSGTMEVATEREESVIPTMQPSTQPTEELELSPGLPSENPEPTPQVQTVETGHGGYVVQVGDVFKIKWSRKPVEEAYFYCRLPEEPTLAKHKYKTMDVLESPHRGPRRYYSALVYFMKVAHTYAAAVSVLPQALDHLPLEIVTHQVDNEIVVFEKSNMREIDLRKYDWVAAVPNRGPYVLRTMTLGDCAANLNKIPNGDSVSLSPY
ncbi:MAG: hypothetical protein KVP17_001246 [Porospora cf. gigantea B]|uniref:uncharacterized protein n=1 Tax=Porospora cf. gigantea B TaxID=2853592 RepID=UPI003571C1B6|nr:MAG: hypothetical protein KVP17_001246 [Porospora cf. gigantea B]